MVARRHSHATVSLHCCLQGRPPEGFHRHFRALRAANVSTQFRGTPPLSRCDSVGLRHVHCAPTRLTHTPLPARARPKDFTNLCQRCAPPLPRDRFGCIGVCKGASPRDLTNVSRRCEPRISRDSFVSCRQFHVTVSLHAANTHTQTPLPMRVQPRFPGAAPATVGFSSRICVSLGAAHGAAALHARQ